MILQNKLGLTSEAELARAEEKLSKTRALELYDTGLLDTFEAGTFKGLRPSINACSAMYTSSLDRCGQ